ncbi:hypothetical protein MLD38_020162, partial [Melastoma candidum]
QLNCTRCPVPEFDSSKPRLWKPRYGRVKQVVLEFARNVEDALSRQSRRGYVKVIGLLNLYPLQIIGLSQIDACLKDLEVLNLNGCLKISDPWLLEFVLRCD